MFNKLKMVSHENPKEDWLEKDTNKTVFSHQQKCKNLLQDRVSSDTGALLRGRAIDARCIGLHRPRENSLE